MARPKNSPEKIEEMRNKMMDAVIELLDDVSPDKISIRMIAEKIGVSHMVFYTYFKDRKEIITALIKREQERVGEQFKNLAEKAKNLTVKQVLDDFIREYSQRGHQHPKIFRLYWLTMSDRRKNALETQKQLDWVYEKMSELLKIGMTKGEISKKDPKLAAFLVMSLINAPIVTHLCGNKPDEFSCQEVLEENIKAVNAYLSN